MTTEAEASALYDRLYEAMDYAGRDFVGGMTNDEIDALLSYIVPGAVGNEWIESLLSDARQYRAEDAEIKAKP